MTKLELNLIYIQLEREINLLSQSTIVTYRSAIKEDAQQVIFELKTDIDGWILNLNERKLTCYELEKLLEEKRDSIKLKNIESKGIDPKKLEVFKNDILRMIAKSIFNTYLNSLFRNPTPTSTKGIKKENLF
ncbi:MAG: hypothetical protein ACYC25_01365 [Paludibacter sp.]